MNLYLYIIIAYMLVLMGFNFYRSKKVKSQDDMMVAGRSLSMRVMVFTLICTWIGSGTFIAGAEYAAKAGWSSLWMPAGAWAGIIFIYFLAGKIRTFGQYTIGDILEVRYGKFARIFGAFALVISFICIVSYQFKAGGFILNVITDNAVSEFQGTIIAAAFVILFTALAGMIAVAYTDLPNGIIIVLACILATPFVYAFAGGWNQAVTTLPPGYFEMYDPNFGQHPFLKAFGYFLSTMLLLMGVQSMYQKFYSAKTPKDAKQAVLWWTVGTIFVEIVVIVIAVFATSYFWTQIDINGGTIISKSIVLQAARHMVPLPIGVLLLAAACVVVLSTGMNYLLSPTTNIMRDIYQKFINPKAEQSKMVALQKVWIVIFGLIAFFLATQLSSVLQMSYFAYTIYGASITPALIAALAWKRATKAGGLASIITGTVVTLGLKFSGYIWPSIMVPPGGETADPWGIPLIYPAIIASVGTLIIVSYLTPPPKAEDIKELFPEHNK